MMPQHQTARSCPRCGRDALRFARQDALYRRKRDGVIYTRSSVGCVGVLGLGVLLILLAGAFFVLDLAQPGLLPARWALVALGMGSAVVVLWLLWTALYRAAPTNGTRYTCQACGVRWDEMTG